MENCNPIIFGSQVWKRIFYGMLARKICNLVFQIFNGNFKHRPSFIPGNAFQTSIISRLCTRNVNSLKKCYLPYKYFLSFQLGTSKLECLPILVSLILSFVHIHLCVKFHKRQKKYRHKMQCNIKSLCWYIFKGVIMHARFSVDTIEKFMFFRHWDSVLEWKCIKKILWLYSRHLATVTHRKF